MKLVSAQSLTSQIAVAHSSLISSWNPPQAPRQQPCSEWARECPDVPGPLTTFDNFPCGGLPRRHPTHSEHYPRPGAKLGRRPGCWHHDDYHNDNEQYYEQYTKHEYYQHDSAGKRGHANTFFNRRT